MSRVSPAGPERLAEFAADFEKSRQTRGYVPNSWLTLARRPKVFRLIRELRDAVMADAGEVPPALRFMIAEVVSNAAGCRYCTAHNAEGAVERGKVADEKIQALWQFQSSPLFTPAEKAALNLALAAGSAPPAATDAKAIATTGAPRRGDSTSPSRARRSSMLIVLAAFCGIHRACATLARLHAASAHTDRHGFISTSLNTTRACPRPRR